MRLSLWVQSAEKAEVYHLWCQRKTCLLARFSCPGKMFSTRNFVSLRQHSDSKGADLHSIYMRKLCLLLRQIVPSYLIICNKSSDNNTTTVKKDETRRWPPALKINILAAPSLLTNSRNRLYRHCSTPLALSQLMNTGWVRHIYQPLLQNDLSLSFSRKPTLRLFAPCSPPSLPFLNAAHFIYKTRRSAENMTTIIMHLVRLFSAPLILSRFANRN